MSAVNFSLSHTYVYSIDTKILYSRKDGYMDILNRKFLAKGR
jgi:hypothetical protein